MLGAAATLLVVASAATTTVLSRSYADDAGTLLEPYYENLNAPLTGCSPPCLTVDTQATAPFVPLGLDGHGMGPNSGSGFSASVSVTTSDRDDLIVVMMTCNPGTITAGVSDSASLTWNTRLTAGSLGNRDGAEYWAAAPTPLSSDAVTVAFTGTTSGCELAYLAIDGANLASPFDQSPAEPAIFDGNSPVACTMTTSGANDALFGVAMQGGIIPSPGVPTGWTLLDSVASATHWDAYEIVSSTLGSAAETWTGTSGVNVNGFCDAVAGGPPSFALPAGSSMDLWSPRFASAASIPAGSLSLQLFADAPAPALDGSATGAWSSGSTLAVSSFSTSKANDVVLVSIATYAGSSSVTASSVADSLSKIAWQGSARSAYVSCSGTHEVTHIEWYGIAATAVTSDVITVALSGTPTGASAIVFGVSGADTTTPFDPSPGLPQAGTGGCSGSGTTPAVSPVSTVADTDLVFALFGSSSSLAQSAGAIGPATAGLVATQMTTGTSGAVEYETMSASQSSDSCGFASATVYWGVLCDALMPARQAIAVSYYATNSAGVVQSTMASASPATITALYQTVSVSSSAGTVPASGYVEVVVTAPAGAALTVYWGSPKPTLFEVASVYRA